MTEETIVQPEGLVEETTDTMTVALQRGAAAGYDAAANVLPALGALMSRTLYGACYYTAYGTTFAAMAIASLIPDGGVIEHGFHDGSEAARHAFHARETATPRAEVEATQTAEVEA
jgi:hypothetical protein